MHLSGLLSSNAAEPSLNAVAQPLASRVTPSNVRTVGETDCWSSRVLVAEATVVSGLWASLHLVLIRLPAMETLFLLQVAFKGVAGFAFALEIIRMIALMTSVMDYMN